MSNQVFFGQESMSKMLEGMAIGANSVSVTMGGNGKTVFIYKKEGHLEATLDGVSVITSIRLKDQIQDAGLKMIQEVSMSDGFRFQTTRCPIEINGEYLTSELGTPFLGEHNDAITKEFRLKI